VGTHRQQRHGEDGRDYLRHRACAAFLAISFRRFLLSPWARAWPPLRPSATAAGSFPSWRARRSSAGRGIVEFLVLGGKHTNPHSPITRAGKTKARLERAKLVIVAARERAAETAQQCAAPPSTMRPPTVLQSRRLVGRFSGKF
jgi:hypothetical protein